MAAMHEIGQKTSKNTICKSHESVKNPSSVFIYLLFQIKQNKENCRKFSLKEPGKKYREKDLTPTGIIKLN